MRANTFSSVELPPVSGWTRMSRFSGRAGLAARSISNRSAASGHSFSSMTTSTRGRRLDELDREIANLEVQSREMTRKLEDIDTLYASRRAPFMEAIMQLSMDREEKIEQRQHLLNVRGSIYDEDEESPVGPAAFSFVEGWWFALACNFVVVLNMATMLFARDSDLFQKADKIFLLWYTCELVAKATYYRRHLLLGKLGVVWWNWLDLLIVISGVIDEVASDTTGNGNVGFVRALRLFRFLRVLKLLRALLQSDMAWTRSILFERSMSVVIGVNAALMTPILQYDQWEGWQYVEFVFLAIYALELAARIKFDKLRFFYDETRLVWNYIDLIIVVGGVVELGLLPFIGFVHNDVMGYEDKKDPIDMMCPKHEEFCPAMTLLRTMRVMRVLRIIALLKAIGPLYKILLGVIESVSAIRWVIVLTLLMLYAMAVLWTTLVGKGGMYKNKVFDNNQFETVPDSIFSLFRLMNGDYDPFQGIKSYRAAQLLFATFLIISNWSILAILTSVVSHSMISSSRRLEAEEDNERKREIKALRKRRLRALFAEVDEEEAGVISEDQWNEILQDPGMLHELETASCLPEKDLQALFEFMAHPHGDTCKTVLAYDAFVDHVDVDFETSVKRSLMLMTQHLRRVEAAVLKVFANVSASRSPSMFESTPRGLLNTTVRFAGHLNPVDAKESKSETGQKSEDLCFALKADFDTTKSTIQEYERTFAKLKAQFHEINLKLTAHLEAHSSLKGDVASHEYVR